MHRYECRVCTATHEKSNLTFGNLKLAVLISYTNDSSSSKSLGHATFSIVAKKQLAMICVQDNKHGKMKEAVVCVLGKMLPTMSSVMADANVLLSQMSFRMLKSGPENDEDST